MLSLRCWGAESGPLFSRGGRPSLFAQVVLTTCRGNRAQVQNLGGAGTLTCRGWAFLMERRCLAPRYDLPTAHARCFCLCGHS